MSKNESEPSFNKEEPIVIRGRRVEDELRLRELELQTNFQINTLSQSLEVLKSEFHSWRDSLNDKLASVEKDVGSLKTRLTAIIVLVLAQMGMASGLITKFIGV